ncbi:MAG TPA: universal stress protein [Hyphomicrobiaceae bacterium]|nr:universal stress protein [Hyphomicrobiaceae bacterium]
MAYKSILVHLNNEARVARLMSAAMQLALPSNSHVTGLFVFPAAPKSPLLPMISGSAIASAVDAYRRLGDEINAAFDSATAGQPVVGEWRPYKPKRQGYVSAVLDHARTADIVVAAQKESDWDYADMFDVPDWLAMESGRPVLVVPKSGNLDSIGQRVVVAWNNSREAARAAFDALPLLQKAQEVTVLSVEEPSKPEVTSDIAGAEIGATLARHGIKANVQQVKPSARGDAGVELLAQVAAHRADLLVMGCFGRSRLREFVLGGASRHVLHNATVPVLMGH